MSEKRSAIPMNESEAQRNVRLAFRSNYGPDIDRAERMLEKEREGTLIKMDVGSFPNPVLSAEEELLYKFNIIMDFHARAFVAGNDVALETANQQLLEVSKIYQDQARP